MRTVVTRRKSGTPTLTGPTSTRSTWWTSKPGAPARPARVRADEHYDVIALGGSNGFLTLLNDGHRLTGAFALGPEAGEWLQQATLAIRARISLEVLRDTIQPFPTFSEIFVGALTSLHNQIAAAHG
jgi:Pyridine nucleotide-disulphide oxidoreductase, dimerisation domain